MSQFTAGSSRIFAVLHIFGGFNSVAQLAGGSHSRFGATISEPFEIFKVVVRNNCYILFDLCRFYYALEFKFLRRFINLITYPF